VVALLIPFSLAQQLIGIFGFQWLQHRPSLADVTMETMACTLLQGKNDIKAAM
jgi:hypothetical protein